MKRNGMWKMAAGAALCALLLTGCAARDKGMTPSTGVQSASPQALNSPAPTAQSMYKDGAYTAETSQAYAEKNQGWQEYVKLTITNGQVAQVEFDALKDGKKKSETTREEYPMDPHPSQWMREIEHQLMAEKSEMTMNVMPEIDGVTGATQSSRTAERLYAAALNAARTGSTQTVTLADDMQDAGNDMQDAGGQQNDAPAGPDSTMSSQ